MQVAWCTGRGQLLCSEAIDLRAPPPPTVEGVPTTADGAEPSLLAAPSAAAAAALQCECGHDAHPGPCATDRRARAQTQTQASAAPPQPQWGEEDFSRAVRRILQRTAELSARVRAAVEAESGGAQPEQAHVVVTRVGAAGAEEAAAWGAALRAGAGGIAGEAAGGAASVSLFELQGAQAQVERAALAEHGVGA